MTVTESFVICEASVYDDGKRFVRNDRKLSRFYFSCLSMMLVQRGAPLQTSFEVWKMSGVVLSFPANYFFLLL